MEGTQKTKCELYNDNFQNFKRYNIPKAQLRDMYHEVCQRSKEESVNNFVLGAGSLLGNTSIKMID